MADLAEQLVNDIQGKFNAPEFATQVVEPVNDEVIRLTKRNTSEGRGLGGNEFEPYAPSTAKKKGRSSPVTFRDTEVTLANMYGEATDNKGEVTFGHNAHVMNYHQKGEGRNPKREIFPEQESNTQTMNQLKEFAEQRLGDYLNGS